MEDEDRYTRITLRIPKDLHRQLSDAADDTSKSLNAEIVGRLAASFDVNVSASAPGEATNVIERLVEMERALSRRTEEESGLRMRHMLQSLFTQKLILQERIARETLRLSDLEDDILQAEALGNGAAVRRLRSNLRAERKWVKEWQDNLTQLDAEIAHVADKLETLKLGAAEAAAEGVRTLSR